MQVPLRQVSQIPYLAERNLKKKTPTIKVNLNESR